MTNGQIKTAQITASAMCPTTSTAANKRGCRRNPPATRNPTSRGNQTTYSTEQGLWTARSPRSNSPTSRVTPQATQGRPNMLADGHSDGHSHVLVATTASAKTSIAATRRLANL